MYSIVFLLFVSDISLAQQRRLDPEDPKVDQKVTSVLEDQVRVLIHDAREKMKESLEAAKRAGNPIATINDNDDDDDDDDDHDDRGDVHPLKYRLNRPEEVLVRLRVDHSGFSTLNNQRFGAKFIGEAANPVSNLFVLYCMVLYRKRLGFWRDWYALTHLLTHSRRCCCCFLSDGHFVV